MDPQILERLRHNDPTLTTLHLLNTHLGNKGAKVLAHALKHNTSLTYLALENNQIGNEGAETLANALQHNTSLTGLCLLNNQIEFNLFEIIQDLINTRAEISEFREANIGKQTKPAKSR